MNYGRYIWGIVVNQDFDLILNYRNWMKMCFLGIDFISLSLISAQYLKDYYTSLHMLSVPMATLLIVLKNLSSH